ncbi:MAG: TIGR03032 family protein [Planctomycetes bacterium]|nr:TIGR03032 family protein [Planctomycetota bacterium]
MPDAPNEPWLEVTSSRNLVGWLTEQRVSLACTTYQAGKLFLFGRNATGQTSTFERSFNRCMGLYANGQSLWMSSLYQLWHFENMLRPGETYQGYDRLYVPKVGSTTGDLDVHDVVVEADSRVVFVNTKFGCLATLDDRYSFKPLWQPPFQSKLAPEDRCHLNGLALQDGKARYVTMSSRSDIVDGWRDHRRDGGIVMDVTDNSVVATGLSMPHSPRVHQGKLWVLDSGTGRLGWIDRATGRFESLTFCPGYLRGLAFSGDWAIVGTSMPRHERTFAGLALEDELKRRNAEPRCGLFVIDLKTGDINHWIRFEKTILELYDVAVLPNVTRPMALGFHTDEIHRILAVGDWGHLGSGARP